MSIVFLTPLCVLLCFIVAVEFLFVVTRSEDLVRNVEPIIFILFFPLLSVEGSGGPAKVPGRTGEWRATWARPHGVEGWAQV